MCVLGKNFIILSRMSEEFKRSLAEMEDFDARIIENKPWAQNLLKNSLAITRKAVLNWCNIVCKIGELELNLDEYVSIFIDKIENLYEELITEVDIIQKKTLDKIKKLLQQMQSLCRDLHVEIPTFNYEELPLCEVYRIILQRVKEYEALAEIRRKELRELNQKQLKLCKNLGREPKLLLPESPLPLPLDIDVVMMHIESLEDEAIEREEKYFQLKDEIIRIVEELGVPPNLDFEKEILNLTNTEVRITDCEMEQLKLYHDRLVKQLSTEVAELRAKVDDLWDKLETDIAERELFRERNTENSFETLQALKNEVKKLEKKKKINYKVLINKLRQELVELWKKCHCGEKERNELFFFYSECYNEDLFELHEREIEKWKLYYEENKEILDLLNECQDLWNEHLKLKMNSDGVNRYKNRRGQLLLEEKLRNKFKKRIPKIEESLLKLSESYYCHKGKPFRTWGKTIEEFINKLHEDEDKEFKLKLSARKPQRDQVSTVGRSRMVLLPSSNTLNPNFTLRHCTSKRKILATPTTNLVKKLKTSNNKLCRSEVPKVNVSLTKRRSARREKLKQRLSFKLINKQRQELVELWKKCHCVEKERDEFTFFYSECYNEDLFELHEREIEKWKLYYEENKEIFALLNEYQDLWNEHLKPELNSDGAKRYKNRGGQLLLEEKLRNKFKKRILKIEESLLKLSKSYYTNKGKPFRTWGKTIEEFINKLHEDEDKEFKLKLSARKQQRDQVSTVGRSRMVLFPSSSSLNPILTPRHCTSKRKILATPITEPPKKLKTNNNYKASKSVMPKVNVLLTKRRSPRREKLRQRLINRAAIRIKRIIMKLLRQVTIL